MKVKLILLQQVENLGRRGDIVQVAKGYARNFLLAQKLAKRVNQQEIDKIEQEKEAQKVKVQEQLAKVKDIVQKLAKKRVSIKQQPTSTGKLYAALQAEDIAHAIYQTYGFRLPAESIKTDPIKSLGIHTFKIVLPGKEEVLMKAKVIEA